MSKADTIRAVCLAQVGDPYIWGAEDCSEQVYDWMQAVGLKVGRQTANDLYQTCEKISGPSKVGDMQFLITDGHAHHVRTFIGRGQISEARSSHLPLNQQTVVRPLSDVMGEGPWGRWPDFDSGNLTDILRTVYIVGHSMARSKEIVAKLSSMHGVTANYGGKATYRWYGNWHGVRTARVAIGPVNLKEARQIRRRAVYRCGVMPYKVRIL